jgi:hypothetical protein
MVGKSLYSIYIDVETYLIRALYVGYTIGVQQTLYILYYEALYKYNKINTGIHIMRT